jgi:hypothetical protein
MFACKVIDLAPTKTSTIPVRRSAVCRIHDNAGSFGDAERAPNGETRGSEMLMQWTRPTWAIAFDLLAYGLILLAILVAAGLSRIAGW